jgi:hypothetical protein
VPRASSLVFTISGIAPLARFVLLMRAMTRIAAAATIALSLVPVAAARAQATEINSSTSVSHSGLYTVSALHPDGCRSLFRNLYLQESRYGAFPGAPNTLIVTLNMSESDHCLGRFKGYSGSIVLGPEGLPPIEGVSLLTDAHARLETTILSAVVPMTKYDCTGMNTTECPETLDVPVELTLTGDGVASVYEHQSVSTVGGVTTISSANGGLRTALGTGTLGGEPFVPRPYRIDHQNAFIESSIGHDARIPQGAEAICSAE